jgi:hypothetical protein
VGQIVEAAKIGKSAFAPLRGQAHDDVDIGGICCIAARYRAENRQMLEPAALSSGSCARRMAMASSRFIA